MRQHFVTFFSPGTFVGEMTAKPIGAWDVDVAVKMAGDIVERYGARPYGFRFSTRSRNNDELDSKQSAQSGVYYLGGRVETLADVEVRNDPNEKVLRSNMRANDIDKVIINDEHVFFGALGAALMMSSVTAKIRCRTTPARLKQR